MFSKMMNRFYYGKSGQGDYTKEDLPQNRMQLFWEMLRVRFAALFQLNLIYVIAWTPAILLIGRAVMMWYSSVMNLAEVQAMVETGEMAREMLQQNYAAYQEGIKALVLQTLLLLVPALAITGPATAGLSYVTRNWARDEHSFVWSDFWQVAKENWKQALLTGFITGIMPLVIYVCFNFYGEMAQSRSLLFVIPQILSLSIALLWLCSLMYIYPQMVTYQLTYGNLIRNSVIMAISRLPMTAALKLLSVVPVAIAVAVGVYTPYMQYAIMGLGAYYVLLGFALSRFIAASYTNGVFDHFLNSKIEGAQVGRGLYVEEDDDDEEENEQQDMNA